MSSNKNVNTPLHDERIKRFQSAGLYVVTSEVMSAGRTTLEIIKLILAAGVKLIQLREKDLSESMFKELAVKVRKLTEKHDALLIINDHMDIAIAVGADGVHLGQDDMPIGEAREKAQDMIIGASSHSVEEAVEAEKAGASYVNIGPIFPTGTKQWDKDFLGIEGVKIIAPHISVPFTVMGGIKKEHFKALRAAGAKTIALVTAVTAAEDPRAAAEELLDEIRENDDF